MEWRRGPVTAAATLGLGAFCLICSVFPNTLERNEAVMDVAYNLPGDPGYNELVITADQRKREQNATLILIGASAGGAAVLVCFSKRRESSPIICDFDLQAFGASKTTQPI
jgi:hypothetical protein